METFIHVMFRENSEKTQELSRMLEYEVWKK